MVEQAGDVVGAGGQEHRRGDTPDQLLRPADRGSLDVGPDFARVAEVSGDLAHRPHELHRGRPGPRAAGTLRGQEAGPQVGQAERVLVYRRQRLP